MDKGIKKTLICVGFGVGLYVLLNNVGSFLGFLETLYSLILPVVVGFIMAFVLNVPMKALRMLYEMIFSKAKRRPPEKAVDVVCVILVLILAALVVWATIMLAIPSLIGTVDNIIDIVQEQLPKVRELFEKYEIDPKILEDILSFLHLDEDYNLELNIGAIVSPLFTTAKSILTGAINFIFALVVCIYALLSKAELHLEVRRMGYALFPEKIARYLGHVYSLVRDTYARFLSAQCIEACILGVMMFLAFLAFGLPYAGLVAVLTAIFAFLPYIGAFGACFIGAFLTLVSEPEKVLLCIIVYTVVQFTENQFIYPHVVGNSIGLSSIWTLIAALVGGNLLGLFGMIFFIPLASVLFTLLGEFTAYRLKKKSIVIEDGAESFPSDLSDGSAEQVMFEFDNPTDAASSESLAEVDAESADSLENVGE